MKRLLLPLVWLGGALGAAAQELPPREDWAAEKGIAHGTLIPGSRSPNGKNALWEFNHMDGLAATTATGIGLAAADRSRLLYVIDSRTKWQTDQEVPTFLRLAWNPSSTLLATHDSGPRHSRLSLYRIKPAGAVALKVPDLLALACARLAIAPEAAQSSGQFPVRWRNDRTLEVEVKVAAPGPKLSSRVFLTVGDEGMVQAGASVR